MPEGKLLTRRPRRTGCDKISTYGAKLQLPECVHDRAATQSPPLNPRPNSTPLAPYCLPPSLPPPPYFAARYQRPQNKTQPMLSMFTEECRLHARTDADMVQQSTSLSTVSSTGVASSRSRPSAMTSTVPRSSSESTSSSGTAEEGVMEYFSSAEVVEPVLPGSEIVVAEQPLGTVERTVELLEVYLPGSATICRWLSRAVAVTFSRVRAWM